MYADDTIFHLSPAGRVGLGVLSAVLAVAMVTGTVRLTRRFAWPIRTIGAVGLFWAFLWLSPQVYYGFYRIVNPGLPDQIVLRWPPDVPGMLRLLTFTGEASLAAHGRGLLGWAMIASALLVRRR